MNYKIMVTGHRQHIFKDNISISNVKILIENILLQYKTKYSNLCILTGMALGTDQWIAEICIKNNIKFKAYLAFNGQDGMWKYNQVKHYKYLLSHATEIKYACDNINIFAYYKRNKMLVNDCNECISVFNGNYNTGTGQTIKELKKSNKKLIIIKIR